MPNPTVNELLEEIKQHLIDNGGTYTPLADRPWPATVELESAIAQMLIQLVPGTGGGSVNVNKTVYVDPVYGSDSTGELYNMGKPYQTIQAVINSLPSLNEDVNPTIVLRNGNYTESVNLSGITITSGTPTITFSCESGVKWVNATATANIYSSSSKNLNINICNVYMSNSSGACIISNGFNNIVLKNSEIISTASYCVFGNCEVYNSKMQSNTSYCLHTGSFTVKESTLRSLGNNVVYSYSTLNCFDSQFKSDVSSIAYSTATNRAYINNCVLDARDYGIYTNGYVEVLNSSIICRGSYYPVYMSYSGTQTTQISDSKIYNTDTAKPPIYNTVAGKKADVSNLTTNCLGFINSTFTSIENNVYQNSSLTIPNSL